MANLRLYDPNTRIYLASPLCFSSWENPTAAELNSNPTNDPSGLVWDITCAVDRADSNFDLGDADVDDSLSFCQRAGDSSPVSYNADISLSYFRSDTPWVISDDTTRNTANLVFSLMAWRGVDYFVIISIGEEPGTGFAVGDRLKMARMGTSDATDGVGTGEAVTFTNPLRALGDVNWNYEVVA